MNRQDKVKIRKFRIDDLVKLKNLIDATVDLCYSDIYCAEAIEFFKDWHKSEKIIQDAHEGLTIVLEIDNNIIGTGTILGNEIVRVFVNPEFQKQGFGKLIMDKLEEKALSETVSTIQLDASIPSKKFYDRLGYVTLEKTFLKVKNNKRLDYYKMQKY